MSSHDADDRKQQISPDTYAEGAAEEGETASSHDPMTERAVRALLAISSKGDDALRSFIESVPHVDVAHSARTYERVMSMIARMPVIDLASEADRPPDLLLTLREAATRLRGEIARWTGDVHLRPKLVGVELSEGDAERPLSASVMLSEEIHRALPWSGRLLTISHLPTSGRFIVKVDVLAAAADRSGTLNIVLRGEDGAERPLVLTAGDSVQRTDPPLIGRDGLLAVQLVAIA